MNVAPTLEIRPGYPVTVMLTQDVIFPVRTRRRTKNEAQAGPDPGPVTPKGRLPGELYEPLAASAGYYREERGEAIDVWLLLIQMMRAVVTAGRGVDAAGRQG